MARTQAKAPTPAPADSAVAELTPEVVEAVDTYEQAIRAIEVMAARRDEAKRVLLADAAKTGRRTFRDRIAVVSTGGSLVLDQAKVRDELGARLPDFQTRARLGWTLKLLS